MPFIQRFLLNMARLIVSVQGRRVTVAVGRYRHPVATPEHQRGWHLMIDPFVPIGRSFKMEKEYAGELLVVSEHLHALLMMTPGVRGLRWFFKGWGPRIPSVRTPADLPWDMEALEIEETQGRKSSE
jgi:hypothetical protein